jgi:4-hydroxy-tetrahydrodipicolinate synthase
MNKIHSMKRTKKGFVPVMITPFLSSGEIDFDGLTRLTETYLRAGVSGLFANCLSSEMYELSDAERQQLVKHVVKVVNGVVPVVATGTFGGPVHDQAIFVKKIYDCGVDAVIAITSMLAAQNESDDVFNERVFNLFEKTADIPMGLYECPIPYKRIINASQLKSFTDTGRILYHKDTCLEIDQVTEKLKATAGCSKFGLYDAYIVNAIESLTAGSAGLSCIQGNYWPELIVWICDNYNNPGVEKERSVIMDFLNDNMQLMHNFYPATAKYCWQKRDLPISTTTRQKFGGLSAEVMKGIDKLHERYITLMDELNIDTRK